MANFLGIGNLVANVVNGFAERKLKKQQMIHAEAMEDGRRITKMDDNDAAYAVMHLQQQQGTWKDEVALITVLTPAWLAFIQIDAYGVSFDGPGIVYAGMSALGQTPVWYQGLLTGAITTALGMSEYAKHQKRSRVSVSDHREARAKLFPKDSQK
jgi:hypothetical protein